MLHLLNLFTCLVYQKDGPALWQLIGSFEYKDVMDCYAEFCKWSPSDSAFPDKIFKVS
jgi:hypothetical protein